MEKIAARLYVDADLAEQGIVSLDGAKSHYLKSVLRLEPGAAIALFNGRDGEFAAAIDSFAKHGATLSVGVRLRAQNTEADLWLLFAPIKRDRIDLVAEKATELGASRLVPVFTRHTVMTRVNVDRLRANAIEAAEQSERLSIPVVEEALSLDRALDRWPADRPLFVCVERGPAGSLLAALEATSAAKAAVLIGPEGGFAQAELDLFGKLPFVFRVSLGPRILRAETAAIAALALIQARLGDWQRADEQRRTLG